MANTRKQNVHAGMGKAHAGSCFVDVDCVAGYVCGNMHNAQSKARAGGLYVDHLGYCLVAQVGSRCASVACHSVA